MQTCYITKLDLTHGAIADLVKPGELTPCWTITRINVPAKFRGYGYGSDLLKRIITDADTEGEILQLEVFSSGDLTDEDLEAWYGRYGFTQTDTGYMSRAPRKP